MHMSKRDSKGRPIKPPMIGKVWSEEDLISLLEALVDIAINRPGDALEMLDHGYQNTPLSAEQYDRIKSAILDSKKVGAK